VDGLTALVSGGYFFDGSPITSLDENEIRSIVRQALASNIQSFCVCGVFSPCRSDQEKRVAEIIREESPNVYITVSHEIAGLGLIERENVSILNACLRPLALRTMRALVQALPDGLPLFLTQNNGILLSLEQCARLPVFTFASGSTNSMIGAAHLTGIQNGIAIDVGGTSTDIGMIVNGRPKQTHAVCFLISFWTLKSAYLNRKCIWSMKFESMSACPMCFLYHWAAVQSYILMKIRQQFVLVPTVWVIN
jgi:N-methylhydantoinase A/oxoprolinase/acetone carboxylase beta subunit